MHMNSLKIVTAMMWGKFRIPKFKISFGFETYEALKEGELDLHFFYDAELNGMAAGKVKLHHRKWTLWEVKYEYKAQDCFKKLVITINGKPPGPSILAQQGDTVIVELKNDHLIDLYINKQIGTPWSDGTEGITQCPITPRDTFVYQFVVDRSGTYLYHAHYGMRREAGLYGSIQVSVPDGVTEPFLYDYDQSIILNDWYHKTPFEQAT
ncbi:hypothetical protein GIB67_007607 [Kingdonia uniflora]|uniref:Plastocyanin-like domain-containing protein n=1 Tax=Kingdonia uniflora TaxID=39325 RepID=A0A7J7N1E9_9MAGN|nr:hypothetical protein GIB67_007607 [Kingdonia uniflora]